MPTIDPLPAAPSRADPVNFAARGDALLSALPAMVVQVNAVSADLTAKAGTVATQSGAAADSAYVANVSRVAAVDAQNNAQGYRDVALAARDIAVQKAADAAASAASASAISGLPVLAGHNGQSLRVKTDGSGMEWVITGDALGFTPVRQGGGAGQSNANLNIGYASAGGAVRIAIDGGASDLGYIALSASNPGFTGQSGTVAFAGKTVEATAFNGYHYGNGANLTGFTAAQVSTALGYVPMPQARFDPGASLEVGRTLDFHAVNSANDFDARLECDNPPGGSGSSTLKAYCNFKVMGGYVDAVYYTGSGQYLTGFTSSQVTNALGYVPLRNGNTSAYTCGPASLAQSTGADTLQITSAGGSNSALMAFHRPGNYAIHLGLNENNVFGLGGWSQGAGVLRWSSDSSGNFIALGNVTSTSDIRFKTELTRLVNVSKRLLAIDHGGMRYLDTRTGEHKYGVSAQGVQKHFPDAVVANEKGHLSVAYGQLALAALIEVTREFAAEIASLKNEVQKLKANA